MLFAHVASVSPIIFNVFGYGFPNSAILNLQHGYYFSAPMRTLIQGEAACVQADRDLGYKTKAGDCRFDNFEFSSVLKFDDDGAVLKQNENSKKNVIVVGDSHAMGWGVSFDQTFSYIISEEGYSVRNYAMSSYGSEQQVLSAIYSSSFRDADYLIFQYCDNDIEKNSRDLDSYLYQEFREYNGRKRSEYPLLAKISNAARLYIDRYEILSILNLPLKVFYGMFFDSIESVSLPNSGDHKKNFLDVLAKYPQLNDKAIIVFYSNKHGASFENWNSTHKNIEFFDVGLRRSDFYLIDDHLNSSGHAKIASSLIDLMESR
jgi:hypothetical protein